MESLNLSAKQQCIGNGAGELHQKNILPFKEACIYTGFSESFMYKLTHRREINFYKPSGKLIFFKRDDIDNFLLKNRISTKDEIEAEAQKYCTNNKKGGRK